VTAYTPTAASTSPISRADAPAGRFRTTAASVEFGPEAVESLRGSAVENTSYWAATVRDEPRTFAPNLDVRAGLVRHAGGWWPVTVQNTVTGNSYPASLHNQYAVYPASELHFIESPKARWAARAGLAGLDLALRLGMVDRTVQWSSWLFSTNLHAPGINHAIEPVTEALASAFPTHAILVKNVDDSIDPKRPDAFRAAGYRLIVSRQVYCFDGRSRDYLSKSTVKRDAKAFAAVRGRDYHVVDHHQFTEADAPRIAALYRQIYLEKHTPLNPRYTDAFVAAALREGWLEFRGLRHASGRLDGVYGAFSHAGVTSIPFIGYDASLPAEAGLYRHLVSLLLEQIGERGQLLNYSSGAGDFKRRRGGKPVIEYNAVYTRHLPPWREAPFVALAALANGPVRRFLEENEI
jgi:Acetyltransferase (GNAT) domain